MTITDNIRSKTATGGIALLAGLTLFVSPAAATSTGAVPLTSVTQLEIIQLFARLHELLRNLAYLIGPVVLLHGLTIWSLGSSESEWSEKGYGLAISGFVLFGLSLAMDILLQMAAYIGDVGS